MKASLKFREDQKPLFRAKVPLCILGLPFQSGISAGDSKELCLNLGTLFESGPSLRIAYRPNDSWNPFSLVLKTGIGNFGSPFSAPMTMSAEFNLLRRGNPSFFIQFKPQFGDFSIKKCTSSPIVLSQSSVFAPKVNPKGKDIDSEAEESVDDGETPSANGVYRPESVSFFAEKVSGFSPEAHDSANAIDGLFSGVEVCARTILPVRNHAILKFRWGLKFPPELKAAFKEDGITRSTAQISLRKIPLMVMRKISVEHVAEEDLKDIPKKVPASLFSSGNVDEAEACFSVKHQLEMMQAENGLLRKAIEDLRTEAGAGKRAPLIGNQDSGKYRDMGRNGGRNDRRGNGDRKSSEFVGGNGTEGDVSEELKKALME